jgi:hypothetical protein
MRPHVLGIDDGPFDKRQARLVPLVAVLMEGNDLVEGVALGEFPVDSDCLCAGARPVPRPRLTACPEGLPSPFGRGVS